MRFEELVLCILAISPVLSIIPLMLATIAGGAGTEDRHTALCAINKVVSVFHSVPHK